LLPASIELYLHMLTLDHFTKQTPRMINLLRRLVEIESPTHEKQAVDQVGQVIIQELKRLNAQVEIVPQIEAGDHILARWPGKETAPGILIIGHMDTVYPRGTLASMPCKECEGRLYGPGTQDMKGGIAITLIAIEALQEQHLSTRLPITALFTSDEEAGSSTSRQLIEQLARQSALVLCMEPGMLDGGLKTWRKGVGMFRMTAYGRAAHAGGDHAQGRNAIEELSYHIPSIQRLTNYELGTTLNVGVIRGGTARNVVPDKASIEVDLRVTEPAEVERVTYAMQALQPKLDGTRLEIQGTLNRPPMPRNELMIATFEKARQIGAEVGLNLLEGGTGGASDANFVAPLGVPVLDGLGPIGEGQHSEREHIQIASLPQRATLLAGLLMRW
jgi:glutamate carboxypeptidase